MAENTREIVYYKGKQYYLTNKGETLSNIESSSNEKVTMLVMTSSLLTTEQYEERLKNQRSKHITW